MGTVCWNEQLLYTTIRIEGILASDDIVTGTGYFFQYDISSKSNLPVIVTNKHVVEGTKEIHLIFTLADNNGNPINDKHYKFIYENIGDICIEHRNNMIDLCIIPIGPILSEASKMNLKLFYRALREDVIPSNEVLDELTAVEDIVMVGYPNDIWDKTNNFPIVRKGITASHPNFNWNGKPEFLIDAACFPGSSGSPVFLYNPINYVTKSGQLKNSPRIKLLGTLYAGPQHTVIGGIDIITVPTKQIPISKAGIPNNLGIVLKASLLVDFIPIIKYIINQKGTLSQALKDYKSSNP